MLASPAVTTIGRIVRQVLKIDRSKIEPGFAIRCTAGVAIPLAIAVALRRPDVGVAAAAGALSVGFASLQGVYRTRAAGMILTSVGMALSTFVGGVAGGSDAAIVVITAVWGFLYGIFASLGASATSVGLNSVLALIIFSTFRMSPQVAMAQSALLLAGGLLQALLLVVVWPFRRFSAERRTLAATYRALSSYDLDAPLAKLQSPDTQTFTAAVDTLADPQPFARRGEIVTFQALLDEAERIRGSVATLATERYALESDARYADALVAFSQRVRAPLDAIAQSLHDGRAPQDSAGDWDALDAAARAIESSAANAESHKTSAGIAGSALSTVHALLGQLRTAWRLAEVPASDDEPRRFSPKRGVRVSADVGEAMQTLRAALSPGSAFFRHAFRLAVVLAIASSADRFLPFHRGYWVPMTALLVLRPDYTTTFSRGVARMIGTLVGAVLATVIAMTLHLDPVSLSVLVVVFALIGYLVITANYAIYTISVTAYVVFLLSLVGTPEQSALFDRIGATLLGGMLALASYVVWPTWERGRVPARLASLVQAQGAYAALVFDAYVDPARRDDAAMRSSQQRAWVERANAEASVDRMLNEPVHPRAIDVRGALGTLAASRRFGVASLALRTYLRDAQPVERPWLAPLADGLSTAAHEIVRALRDRMPPEELPPLRTMQQELATRAAAANDADAGILAAETDLMVDGLNTIAELLGKRFGSSP